MSKTVLDSLIAAKSRGSQIASMFKKGGTWQEVTWREYYDRAEKIAGGLRKLGIERGDRVAVISETRLEWALIDLGTFACGGVTVPIYPSNTEEDIKYILNNSESKVLIVENQIQQNKWENLTSECGSVIKVISIEDTTATDTMNFNDFLKFGGEFISENPSFVADESAKTTTDDMATIIYTSGTTGLPKGVVLTHLQIISELEDAQKLLNLSMDDRNLAFLPMSHVFGRLEAWIQLYVGFTTAYAESIEKIRDNLGETSPTIIIAVPRIFEKIYNGVISKAETSPVKFKLFKWALSVGSKVSKAKLEKRPVPLATALQYKVATKLVFEKLHKGLGGRLKWALSGSAPLSRQIAEFFHAAGILVLEGYGLTETTAGICVNAPHDYAFGCVGKPIGDAQVKIASDGEILIKSDKVMKEYYKNPEATAEALKDGWFHTGDIGEFDENGRLKITDRKKDLIKTAGGKYVAPQKLENLLKLNKYISNVLIHGDQKKYVVALVTLDPDQTAAYAAEKDISYSDFATLTSNDSVKGLVRDVVAETNSQLASFETIKNFAILPKDFTIEDGELTPSLKVKRKVCDEKYSSVIDGLYGVDRSAL